VSAPGERTSAPDCVRLDAASVRFGRVRVLRDVTLSLPEGDHVCVRGANGAGKTTLLRLVAGAIRPTTGARRGPRSCAYVPPAVAPPALTVTGWLAAVRRIRVEDPTAALAVLGFDGDTGASCRSLSFGNLRKVLLADAFTASTRLVAVDEVHVGLDHAGRRGLDRLVHLARSRGAAVVVAAQDDDPVDGVERTVLVRDASVTDAVSSDHVRRTLRGPRAAEAELLEAAERLGFHPVEGDGT
jgi:ABC-type multidrug transport system ATPase subunit